MRADINYDQFYYIKKKAKFRAIEDYLSRNEYMYTMYIDLLIS